MRRTQGSMQTACKTPTPLDGHDAYPPGRGRSAI